MADIRCLICNRVNDASAERCWYCRSRLPGGNLPSGQNEPEDIAGAPPEPAGDILSEKKEQDLTAEEPKQDVPEWLARIRELKSQEKDASPQSAQESAKEEIPGWLENLRDNTPSELGEKTTQKSLLQEDGPENQPPGAAQSGEMRIENKVDQAASGHPDDGEAQPAEPYKDGGESLKGDSLPPATEALLEQAAPGDRNLASEPFFPSNLGDLPEWLTSDKDVVDKITSSETQAVDREGEKLEKGKLPAWLNAIRPLQVISPIDSADEPSPVSEEGVLAGISGTLRSLNLEDREFKPSTNPHELIVSSAQQKNAELLRNLLQPAAVEASTPAAAAVKNGRINLLWIGVVVIMLLSVLLPFLTRLLPAVIPVLYPKEVVDTLGFIQEMRSDKPVLIAAQFEAGLAGELTWTSELVIEHLVSRGIPVVLVSTNVSGYAVLEEQIVRAAANNPGYPLNEKVINLGYLPGGTIGLISLVSDPRLALPFSTDLKPAWESNAFENVVIFSDFGAVMLLTDNPEIVRAWVEQSGRVELPPPLIALTSAQAAPLVQPYHNSGQVRGYIAGSAGALAYQLIRQVPGSAATAFPSYQLAVLAAALLIFLGGLVSLVGSTGTGSKKKGAG